MSTILRTAAGLFLMFAGSVFAQSPESQRSGAVESFEPEFSAAYVMQPRVGLFGITELMMAGLNGDLDAAIALIKSGADVNETDDSLSTALMWSAWSGNAELVTLLIDNGADVNQKATNGANALGNALSSGRATVAVLLLDAGADPNTLGDYSRPHLDVAARAGHLEVVNALIRHGVDIDRFGPGALNIAVAKNSLDIVERLLEAGTDVNALATSRSSSPLLSAVYTADLRLVEILLDAGADPNGANPGNTPLRVALGKGYLPVARTLIDRGANMNSAYLSEAIAAGRSDVVSFVLERINVDTFSESELEQLLLLADSKGQQALVHRLLNAASAPRFDDDTVQLLFRQVREDSCSVSIWSPGEDSASELRSVRTHCDAELFVADRADRLFAVEGDTIYGVSLSDDAIVMSVAAPTEQMSVELDALKALLSGARSDIDFSWMTAKLAVVGFLETGDLAVGMHVGGVADETYGYLFGLIDGEWLLVSQQDCHRFDWRCRFSGVNGRPVDDWQAHRSAWHPAVRRNRHFVSKATTPNTQSEYGGQIISLEMMIDGEPLTLRVETAESGHCADDCTYTARLVTHSGNAEPVILAENSGNASLADRFALVSRGYNNGFELVDIRTGQSLFGRLDAGTWVESGLGR